MGMGTRAAVNTTMKTQLDAGDAESEAPYMFLFKKVRYLYFILKGA